MKRMKQADDGAPEEGSQEDLEEDPEGEMAEGTTPAVGKDSQEEEGGDEEYEEDLNQLTDGDQEVTKESETNPDEEEDSDDNPGKVSVKGRSKSGTGEEGSVRVRIRRFGRRKRTELGDKEVPFKEQDLPLEDKSKLEKALRERLQKAGVDTGGKFAIFCAPENISVFSSSGKE